jgi:hypothetical protein
MADQTGLPVVEPAMPATDQEKHDGSSGIGMDGAGGSGTSKFLRNWRIDLKDLIWWERKKRIWISLKKLMS